MDNAPANAAPVLTEQRRGISQVAVGPRSVYQSDLNPQPM